MKLQIKVTTSQANGGSNSVIAETSLATIIKWERQYKKRAGDLAAGFSVEDLAFMAWSSLQAHGVTATFEQWIETLEELEVVDSQESHPTGGVATEGN